MNDFLSVYVERKQEIKDFFSLLVFLEAKEKSTDENGISEFDKFFYSNKLEMKLTYQVLINIMKSNVSLMIYNVIEYTVTSLMLTVYDEIERKNLSYFDVNDYIRKLWKKNLLKAVTDPNANFSTFVKKNDEIIEAILSKQVIKLEVKNNLPGGNLGAEEIKTVFGNHGINWNISKRYFRPDIMEKIKKDRNELAHGAVSFTEALRDNTISDLQKNYSCVEGFLDELIVNIKQFLKNENYKHSEQ